LECEHGGVAAEGLGNISIGWFHARLTEQATYRIAGQWNIVHGLGDLQETIELRGIEALNSAKG
jgi:hypothetical protein